ncbi:MAG TPA: hypothetical protein VKQ07_00835 [Jatrophihabitantaceae bacterium]|nr:hypothetical protein [Jatrophihabitantaceae bacterium]
MNDELAPALSTHVVDEVIARALLEDVGADGDVTTLATIAASAVTSADLVPRADGVVAGLPVAARVFETVGQGRVRVGGGVNHRMSLSDAALIKDNHVASAGGVVRAFELVRSAYPALALEVEADTVEQARAVIDAGAELVLLDNMTVDELRAVVGYAGGRCRLEASGGLTLDRARAVAETGVDYLAVGALTHSAPVLDIGLDLQPTADR